MRIRSVLNGIFQILFIQFKSFECQSTNPVLAQKS